jgi:hypothetical protein
MYRLAKNINTIFTEITGVMNKNNKAVLDQQSSRPSSNKPKPGDARAQGPKSKNKHESCRSF